MSKDVGEARTGVRRVRWARRWRACRSPGAARPECEHFELEAVRNVAVIGREHDRQARRVGAE